MATITLTGNTLSGCLGVGSFTNIGTALSKAKQTTGNLTKELSSLKIKIDVASTAANLDTSKQQTSNSKNRGETQKSSLTLAYNKLDKLISNVGTVDNKVATKVEQLKNDFYSKYSYLKPECEKGAWEKIKDDAKNLWNGICDLGNAIANVFLDVVEWVTEHWKELLIGLVFIVVGALITVFTGGTGTAFWVAFGIALLKGLAAATISAVIGGIISGGITYYQYRKAGYSNEFAMENAKKAFGNGAANGFMTGGIGFAVGASAIGVLGKGFLIGHGFWGSVGRGAMFGATTNAITSPVATALSYWLKNGTLKGSTGVIIKSFISGAISGGIFGGIMGGVQYKYSEYKISKIEDTINKTDFKNTTKGKLWETEGINEYGKRYPDSKYATQGKISSDFLINKKGNSSYSMPDQLVEIKSGEFINYDYKWGSASKTYNQSVLTGIKGFTSGRGNGTSHVIETVFSTTKKTVMHGNFSTNVIPVGTPFIELHPWDYNSIIGVPINSIPIIGVNSGVVSIINEN